MELSFTKEQFNKLSKTAQQKIIVGYKATKVREQLDPTIIKYIENPTGLDHSTSDKIKESTQIMITRIKEQLTKTPPHTPEQHNLLTQYLTLTTQMSLFKPEHKQISPPQTTKAMSQRDRNKWMFNKLLEIKKIIGPEKYKSVVQDEQHGNYKFHLNDLSDEDQQKIKLILSTK